VANHASGGVRWRTKYFFESRGTSRRKNDTDPIEAQRNEDPRRFAKRSDYGREKAQKAQKSSANDSVER
jgi:hypothetical protein